jgi:hypothetical protein
MTIDRRTPDLSGYPDLAVVHLGMRVRKGIVRLRGIGLAGARGSRR